MVTINAVMIELPFPDDEEEVVLATTRTRRPNP